MSTKKPAIPSITLDDPATQKVVAPMKENLEILMGRRGTKLTPLQSTATLAQCITQLNAIVALLQG